MRLPRWIPRSPTRIRSTRCSTSRFTSRRVSASHRRDSHRGSEAHAREADTPQAHAAHRRAVQLERRSSVRARISWASAFSPRSTCTWVRPSTAPAACRSRFKFASAPRHLVTINAAYSSDLGGSGGITWSDRNVFGNAEQLNLSASLTNVGGSATTGLGYNTTAKFILPDFGHRDQSLQFAVGAVKLFLQAYDQTAVTTRRHPHAQAVEILDGERRREHRRRADPAESAVLLSNQRHRIAGALCAARSHACKIP